MCLTSGTKRAFGLDGNNHVSAAQVAARRWSNLSKTAKIAIFSSVVGSLVIAIALFIFCCIRQRKAGKKERAAEDAEFEKGTADLLAFRAEMSRQRAMRMEHSHGGFGGKGYQRF